MSSAITVQLIIAFVFATWLVQSLFYLNPKLNSLAFFCGCAAQFVSDLVRNTEDRFSRDTTDLSIEERLGAISNTASSAILA